MYKIQYHTKNGNRYNQVPMWFDDAHEAKWALWDIILHKNCLYVNDDIDAYQIWDEENDCRAFYQVVSDGVPEWYRKSFYNK